MAKGGKKQQAAQYESGTLAVYAVAGIVLMGLGVLSLLSVVGGLKGVFFSQVRRVMQGLGGGLCIGVSVLLIWAGLLTAISTGRHMPKKALLLVTALYVAVLSIVNLTGKVGQYGFMEYLIQYSNSQTPPVPNADGFAAMAKACFAVCAGSGAFGGIIGMLLGWPAWSFLGVTLGTVALGLLVIVCVLLLSRFDVKQMMETIQGHVQARSEARAQRQAQEAYRQQFEEQQRQAEENDRKLITPAFLRRQPEETTPSQQPYPAGMTMEAMQAAYQAYTQQMAQMQQNTAKQPEMYDEIVMPQDTTPLWKRGRKKAEKQQPAYQTRMTFTPSEMGMGQPDEDSTMILSASKRKAQERIEAIRKRKADITRDLDGNEKAQAAPDFAPRVQAGAPLRQTAETGQTQPSGQAQPVFHPAVLEETADDTTEPSAPIQQQPDRHSAYRRPAGEKPVIHSEQTTIPYAYPSIDLLNPQRQREAQDTRASDAQRAAQLEKTLESFSIPAKVQRVTHGPAVTRFELGLVSSGINVKRIMSIADNIALDMAANGGVRIEIPIPGTNLFGVEVPNQEVQSVTLGEVLVSPEMCSAKSPLAVALGRDIAGKPVICDIAKMPHLLIAGQTGSGKSVCINAIINSILFRSSPEEVRMIMIDPKVVELQCYNVVPHLLIPVVSDPHKAAGALAWAVAEMLDRYHKIESKKVRDITAYNAKLEPGEPKLPRIVIIIDELADLMLACKKEVEESIIRIAQLARAAGIHLIVATQRPTVDVITGLIKANIPSRIAFAVSSSIDSRTILDQNGAEKLLGRGDMFYFPTGAKSPIRVQGCFLSDAETERVVDYIAAHSQVEFDNDVIEAMENEENMDNPLLNNGDDGDEGVDDRLEEAIDMVLTDGQASISMLQRRMKIGYARAGRLIDDMAARGIISKSAGSKPREVLMSREEYERSKAAQA